MQAAEQQADAAAQATQQMQMVEQELEAKSREAADLLSDSLGTKARTGLAVGGRFRWLTAASASGITNLLISLAACLSQTECSAR